MPFFQAFSIFYTGRQRKKTEKNQGCTRRRQALQLPAVQRQRSGQEHDCPEEVPQVRRGEVLLPGTLQPGLGPAQAAVPGYQIKCRQ
jgi:hypothetical protein